MEEYDDLSAGPDDDGVLNLSHGCWKRIPDEIIRYGSSLIQLNCSHNCLGEIPNHISSLISLKVLNVSHNSITRIDPAIGKCIRLRHLDVSNNWLESLPIELGNCVMLEALNCFKNRLRSIPKELGTFLTIIDIRDNELETIPTTLSLIPTLNTILCEGNDALEMIPTSIKGQSNLVIWCLRLHHSYISKLDVKTQSYIIVEDRAKESEERRFRLDAELKDLTGAVHELKEDLPVTYMANKNRMQKVLSVISNWKRSR